MLQQSSKNAPTGLEQRSAHVIHYNISYVVQGADYGTDGAIVLLHDLLGGAFTWDAILPQLANLKRAVYAIDMLGYTSVWGHADSLSLLLNQLQLTNIILVGHGLGGGVAQVLATRLSADRVASLILINTICYEHAFAPDWPLKDMAKAQDPEFPGTVEQGALMQELNETLPNAAVNGKGFLQIINQYMDPWNSHVGKEVLFQHIRLLVPYYSNAVSSDLKALRKPVLLIWSEKDQQNPLHYGERLFREIPGSRLVVIQNAGHLVLFDAPDQVAGALNDFISQL
jgi:pimeloyl-ACP methyl ester carboxylesterase